MRKKIQWKIISALIKTLCWNPIGNLSKVIDKPIQKITNSQLNIKLGQFTKEELDAVLKSYKPQWNMEDKKIWQHISPILQQYLWPKHKEMDKGLLHSSPRKTTSGLLTITEA